MIKICSIVGIRPQYIKMSKVMRLMDRNKNVEHIIINSGQHYDYNMAQVFFENLKIPNANYNLEVGSGSHAKQMSKMLIGIENILIKERPDVVVVIGDGNSTLAGALISSRLNIPVAHIEAGLRSYNLKMPEEVNRILTDHCSSVLFAPTENAYNILLREGILKDKIYLTGDVTVDILNENLKISRKSSILNDLELKNKDFILLTLHRAENVDDRTILKNILKALSEFNNIIFPIHPRTKKMIDKVGLREITKNMMLIEPVGYFDFLKLLENCSLVITDSGGVQKEAFLLKVPCVTIRTETEWIETIEAGANIVAGIKTDKIKDAINKMKNKKIKYATNPFGNGKSSEKIIEIITKALS